MIVRIAHPSHYPWIAERAQLVIGPGFQAIEAVDDAGVIKGMVAYDCWTPNAVSMHVAMESPIAGRRLLRPAFGIPFVELGRSVILAQVLSTNPATIDLDLHLGFREVTRLRDAWKPGVDIVLLEMRREECRWIRSPEKHLRSVRSVPQETREVA